MYDWDGQRHGVRGYLVIHSKRLMVHEGFGSLRSVVANIM